MYQFWYDYIKPKYDDNVKLCYMDTDSFIFHVKTEDFYENTANDVEKRFDTSNYKDVKRPLPIGVNKKELGLIKDELSKKVMVALATLRAKTYAYLQHDGKVDKRAKGTKKCVRKRVLKYDDYKDCVLKNETILKSQQIFKSEGHNVHTVKVNKKALANTDDKRLQTYDGITTYPYGTNAGRVCKTKLLSKVKRID